MYIGVAPLQNNGRKLVLDSSEKAEILNKQFQSVFIQDDGNEISGMDDPEYSQINNLIINVNAVNKLFKELNVNKP